MALRVTTSEKTKKSGKKPKTLVSKKQAAKINAMKPKKPPTAFFYYLYVFYFLTFVSCSINSIFKYQVSVAAMIFIFFSFLI